MPFTSYIAFVLRQPRFAAFGFLMAFASSFGQTYFIGVFGPSIQAEFGWSHTLWGTIYMLGTLASAALLPWTGKLLDTVDLPRYTVAACLALAFACAFTALASGTLALVVAVFLLRQTGQGIVSHIGITTMARYFERERGRAIAVATVGFAAGEAVLPSVAVAAIAAFGWRASYGGLSVILALTLVPLTLWLCRGHAEYHRAHLDALHGSNADAARRAWTRAEVLRDPRFYLLLPGVLAPALILTALFFHHLNLADAKGWSHAWITGSYVIYATAATIASLTAGSLIDRFGGVRLVPHMLLPLALGLTLVWALDTRWVVWPYLILAGLSIGIAHTAVSALWAELYGLTHLGAIKSLAKALSVFASALGPICMGALVDVGTPIDRVCLWFALYAVAGALALRVALHPARVPARAIG